MDAILDIDSPNLSVALLAKLLMEYDLFTESETILKKILIQRQAPEVFLLLGDIYEKTNH